MNELYHYGIKGMRWGVRRFQNPDGTLTAAGKRREQASSDRLLRKQAKKQREWNAKNTSQLSDKELTDQILRLQREKQLKDLTNQSVSPGKKRVKDFLSRNGELILATAISAGVTARVNQGLKPKGESEYDKIMDRRRAEDEAVKSGVYRIDDNGKLKRTYKDPSTY